VGQSGISKSYVVSRGFLWIKNQIENHMLIGEYTHVVDEKNRVSLPSKFRSQVGKKVVITHGLDACLFLYSMKEWEKISEKLSSLSIGQASSRGFNRFMLAGAVEVEIDKAGRILVPEFLKKFAGLGASIVFAGVHNRVEIWDETRWTTYKKQVESQADQFAEKLGEIGMI
jgi:MraZ protein